MTSTDQHLVVTYVGPNSEIETAPRRTRYYFEQHKSQAIGFKRGEIHPKDAELLSRKIDKYGNFLFQLE